MTRRVQQPKVSSLAPQRVDGIICGEMRTAFLPPADSEVVSGLLWGDATEFFTPAFWAIQAWQIPTSDSPGSQRLGSTFAEEVGACLLGGHGLPAEIGIAAFERLRKRGLLRPGHSDESALFEALREPLVINDRAVRYLRSDPVELTECCGPMHALKESLWWHSLRMNRRRR
jgi:hypothetical protein